jgi:hypothetical protein
MTVRLIVRMDDPATVASPCLGPSDCHLRSVRQPLAHDEAGRAAIVAHRLVDRHADDPTTVGTTASETVRARAHGEP